MPSFVYRVPTKSGAQPFVEVSVEDGEELTEAQAAVVILDQIDTRLFDIAQKLGAD